MRAVTLFIPLLHPAGMVAISQGLRSDSDDTPGSKCETSIVREEIVAYHRALPKTKCTRVRVGLGDEPLVLDDHCSAAEFDESATRGSDKIRETHLLRNPWLKAVIPLGYQRRIQLVNLLDDPLNRYNASKFVGRNER
jgi:hypothetical protein